MNVELINVGYNLMKNPKEGVRARLYAVKFLTSCLLEANIQFLENFQDHEIMNYFSQISFDHTFNYDETTFGTRFLNDKDPQKVEQQNSQNFIRMIVEVCQILAKFYPIRQNQQKSVSEFKQLIENMQMSECYLPPQIKILAPDENLIQNSLKEQNYVGQNLNANRQDEVTQGNYNFNDNQGQLIQNQNLYQGSTQNNQNLYQSNLASNQNQSNLTSNQNQTIKGTPEPKISESHALKLSALTQNDYQQQYNENLKVLEQTKTQCLSSREFPQNVDIYHKKIQEFTLVYQSMKINDEKLKEKIELLSILNEEVLFKLDEYKKNHNLQELKNFFQKEYAEIYNSCTGEQQQDSYQNQPQNSQIEKQKLDQQLKDQQAFEQQLLKQQQEQQKLFDEQKIKEQKEKEKEIQLQIEKQKEDELKRQIEQQHQQQIKKQKEEEQRQIEQRQIEQRQIEQRQIEQRQIEQRQIEQRQIEQRQIEQRQIELERQREQERLRELERQREQEKQREIQKQEEKRKKDNDPYTGNQQNALKISNQNEYNIYQNRQKIPSVIEEENEDQPQSNRNLAQIKQDSQQNKKYHSLMNQSIFKSGNNDMKNSRFQSAINQMADMEKSKLKESRVSARSYYEQEKANSMIRLDPHKSKPMIYKGISHEDHKSAINKGKEEEARLQKVIFSKDAEISSQKDEIRQITKQMIEYKTNCHHQEKDIINYQQQIQLYEKDNSKGNEILIQQIHLLEQQLNDEQIRCGQAEEKNQILIQEKLSQQEQINLLASNNNELEQKNHQIENDLEAEKQKQKILEERISEKLSKNQNQLERDLTQANIDNDNLKSQLQNQTHDYDVLKKQFNDINSENLRTKNEFAAYKAQVESDQLYGERKSLNRIGEKEEQYNQIQSLLQQRILLLEQENNQLKIAKSQEEEQLHLSKVKTQNLEKELEQLRGLQQQFNNQKNIQHFEQNRQQADQLQEDLKSQVKLNQEQNQFIFEIHKEINQERKLNEELKQNNNYLNENVKNLAQRVNELETEREQIEAQQTQIQEQNDNLFKENEDLYKEIEELKNKKDPNIADQELLENVGQLQEINKQLHNRIEQLLYDAQQYSIQTQERERDQHVEFPKRNLINCFNKLTIYKNIDKTENRISSTAQLAEDGGEQGMYNRASYNDLSDTRRLNDPYEEQYHQSKPMSNFNNENENNNQRGAYHGQPMKLSEITKRNKNLSPEQKRLKSEPIQFLSSPQDRYNQNNYFSNQQVTLPHNSSPQYFPQDYFSTIPPQQMSDMRYSDPDNPALTYHSQNPMNHYQNQAPQNIQAKIIKIDNHQFEHISLNPQTLYKFKRSCLKDKFPIFESQDIQVGIDNRILKEQQIDLLEINLYFKNMSDDLITDFCVFPDFRNNQLYEIKQIDHELQPGIQKQLTIYVGISQVPFQIILLDFSYKLKNQPKRQKLALPNTINKFFQPELIDIQTFQQLWNSYKEQVYSSEEIFLDAKVVKNSSEFVNYFKNLLVINENQLVGCFSINYSNTRFLLKISVGPNSQAVFQVALLEQSNSTIRVMEQIIQQLSFIFRHDQ